MKIIVTRPALQAKSFGEALVEAGFTPVYFPVIEICPFDENIALDRALEKICCYDWIIFTSANAAEIFFDRIKTIHPKIKIAAIGPKTAHALKARGVMPDFVPNEYLAERIADGLGDLRGRWVLLPRAEKAREALPEAIANAGGIAHEIAIYRTLNAQINPEGLTALMDGADAITFTSSSTVENFIETIQREGLDPFCLPNNPVIACIGPVTRKTAQEAGFTNLLMAEEYTTDGLVRALSANKR